MKTEKQHTKGVKSNKNYTMGLFMGLLCHNVLL